MLNIVCFLLNNIMIRSIIYM
ncbi:unnamed protein product [Cuscuta europaea]|uniref:Uncharacterized protein n=1 Tax=Cuscuta europaea TaxID=41803 RepID=A0A9P1EGJ6_CUSEU|nr:unnamed protein product [Cuscuta europaea]